MNTQQRQRHTSALLFIFCLAILCLCHSQIADQLLHYQRQNLNNGEWWRLISCHLTHTNWPHLAMNAAGLGVAFYLDRQMLLRTRDYIQLLLLSISTGLVIHFYSDIQAYRGLSGILHGLLLLAAYQQRHQDSVLWYGFLGLLSIKIVAEQRGMDNQLSSQLIEATVMKEAHLAGFITALLIIAVTSLWQRHKP